jgi:AraC-like DNA-binding protein
MNDVHQAWLQVQPEIQGLLRHLAVRYTGLSKQALDPSHDPQQGPGWSRRCRPATMVRVILIEAGRAEFTVKSTRLPAKAGDVAVIADGVAMGGAVDRSAPFRCKVLYLGVWLARRLPLFRLLPCPPVFQGETARGLQACAEQVEQLQQPGDELTAAFEVHELLLHLLRQLYAAPIGDTLGTPEVNHPAGSVQPQLLQQAVALMLRAARQGTALSIGELAAQLHRERASFSRLFAKHMGMPPGRFLEKVRMDWACDRLRDHDRPVADVAASVGYSDPYHFSRVFHRVIGCSPSAWRANEERLD